MVLIVASTLSGCEKQEDKADDRPELYKGFKPAERSDKGF